nr:hypothetical protein CFP56_72689 [Quercus suber]
MRERSGTFQLVLIGIVAMFYEVVAGLRMAGHAQSLARTSDFNQSFDQHSHVTISSQRVGSGIQHNLISCLIAFQQIRLS